MVIGLALLATTAMAQTDLQNRRVDNSLRQSVVQRVERPAVDYKASIFTKAFGTNVGDTIPGGFWNFDNTQGMVYGQNGTIGANEYVYMENADSNYAWVQTAVLEHNIIGDAVVFMLLPDTGYIRSHASTYNGGMLGRVGLTINTLCNYVFDGEHTNFMFIAAGGVTNTDGLQPSSFFKLPAIVNPGIGNMYEVRFVQDYLKFVEDTWIDFKVGNSWYAVPTNVRNIDATVNGWNSGYRSYTLPVEFGQQDSLEIRFRYGFHNRDGYPAVNTGYGYYWAVDDVAIVRAASEHWYTTGDQYIDGGYATIPVGFNVPLSWYGSVFNDGAQTISNARATVYHQAPGAANFTTLTQKDATDLFPSVSAEQLLTINERGWYDSIYSPGWFGYALTWNDTNNSVTLPSSYTKHGLPTTNIGLNKVTVTGTVVGSSAYDVLEFDTIAYRVVDISGGEGTNLIEGYRWAHDNGIIPSNSIWKFGNFYQGTSRVVTSDGNYDQAGYLVGVRYTTPDVIPTDNGEPWVIRGIELVPRTDTNVQASMIGDRIQPVIFQERYFDSSDGNMYHTTTYLGSEFTGLADDYVYTVTGNDVNADVFDLGYGRIAPGDDYNAINIRYPSQPALLPNTSYYIGYMMAQDGWFATARHLYGYRNSTGTTTRYNADPDLMDYYRQFTPYYWDVFVRDAFNTYAGNNYPYWPMIRLIVGPREELETYSIAVDCPSTDNSFEVGAYVDGVMTNVCNDSVDVVEGSDGTVYIFGVGDSSTTQAGSVGIIDAIVIDGQTIGVNNEDAFYGNDYNITAMTDILRNANGDVLLTREYYIVTLTGVTSDRTVSAVGHMYPFNLGIEGEAVDVRLGLQPNPATNNVTINMSGVTGMVDCSIIDMSGRVVYSRTVNAENSQVIDLSNVAAGAYFVRVTNDSFSKVEKLIVR